MGGQSSKDYPEDDVGDGKKKKKGGIMNCHCGKGRDDQDEVVSDPRTGKGTRLSEEEWAQVKTGKLQGIPGAPDLLAEEAVSSHRRHRKRKDDEAEETEMLVAGSTHTRHAEPPSAPSGSHLRLPNEQSGAARFAANDRVKCACTRWGSAYEIGTIVKVGYREPSWPAGKPSAPYQVKLDKGALIYAPEDSDEYIQLQDESWAKELPAGAPWYLQPGALDRELAKIGAYR
ncbi:hypothetical protein T484DRAFT_1980439 [Baffinella frigidus]|nr:hypothetical protein T484DRAFT_1980439 [Cryptophyta sp. CCMP2293]